MKAVLSAIRGNMMKGVKELAEVKISLAAARVNAGLTQSEAAKELHVTKQTLVNWEKNKSIPKPAQFYMLCEIYKIPRDFIFLPKSIT